MKETHQYSCCTGIQETGKCISNWLICHIHVTVPVNRIWLKSDELSLSRHWHVTLSIQERYYRRDADVKC